MTPRELGLRLLIRILAHPNRFSRKQLAKHFECHTDTIKDNIKIIRNVGIQVEQERKAPYRYTIIPDRTFKELHYLQPLTKAERAQIGRVLQQSLGSSKEANVLIKKLDSLYDFQQLGLRALRAPALERINRLQEGINQKKQVTLEKYRSNSSQNVRDRLVEPFLIDPELDTLQAFDVTNNETRHFRLSRIERVLMTDTAWAHESKHVHKYTDVFRIVDDKPPIMVHLKLNVLAYNVLTETYPKSLSEIQSAATPNTYDFQTRVNTKFYGLINFIMGHAEHVEICSPQALKDLVRSKADAILKKNDS